MIVVKEVLAIHMILNTSNLDRMLKFPQPQYPYLENESNAHLCQLVLRK